MSELGIHTTRNVLQVSPEPRKGWRDAEIERKKGHRDYRRPRKHHRTGNRSDFIGMHRQSRRYAYEVNMRLDQTCQLVQLSSPAAIQKIYDEGLDPVVRGIPLPREPLPANYQDWVNQQHKEKELDSDEEAMAAASPVQRFHSGKYKFGNSAGDGFDRRRLE